MNFEEFLQPKEEVSETTAEVATAESQQKDDAPAEEAEPVTEDIDVQKAVVESLAADKVEMDETIVRLRNENISLKAEIESLKLKLAEQSEALAKVGDILADNSNDAASNKVSLIDRDVEIGDRFPGETRDHVLEAVKEARDRAEAEGRVRRAQLLESVMLSNEPSGNLSKKRAALEKFFNDNHNVMTGPVIEELTKCGISYKNGEEYLLPSEIIRRTY